MKTLQLVSLVAAAGLIAGCSTENRSTIGTNPPNPTPGTAVISGDGGTSQMVGNPAYNFNQGSYNPPGTPGTLPKHQLSIDDLPQAAQTAIRNQIGQQQISSIKEESKDGQSAYKVELQRKDWHSLRPSLTVASDGSILNEFRLQSINEAAGAQNSSSSSATNSMSGSDNK